MRDSQASLERARAVLGYEPRVGLEEGLRRTWEWFVNEPDETRPAAAATAATRAS